MSASSGRTPRFQAVDVLVLVYTSWVALFIALLSSRIPGASTLVIVHAVVLAVVAILPRRGAPWESAPPGEADWKRRTRGGLRFLRYVYPVLLVIFFFEEVEQTVNALWPRSAYWFEPFLYAADRWFFGALPAVALDPLVGVVQNEIAHAFYLSYYFIVAAALVYAWLGGRRSGHPAPGFETTLTSTMASFFFCFVWYPFLPARGPWENEALTAALTPFEGLLFTPLVESIIDRGAVSGGCFPSSHVAGSWGAVLGLAPFQPRVARILAVFALGMSLACVYTRYHHGVDVPAGMLAGILGVTFARRFASEARR